MCGIAGIYGRVSGRAEALRSMTDAQVHRGPDAEGYYTDNLVALGHRRLSIIDLSTGANQPIASACGRYVLAFNGEIYNFAALRAALPGYPFATQSDTEVLLAGLAKYGIGFVHRCHGMFAFALWDKQQEKLTLCRDRLGVKPLYYARSGQCLLFASEVMALLASGSVPRRLHVDALPEYVRYQTVGGTHTLVEGVYALPPGSYMEITDSGEQLETWWSPLTHFDRGVGLRSAAETLEQVQSTFIQAVSRRLVSDVPLGVFLSGGIDSSAVVAAAAQAVGELRTFTVTFGESRYNEAPIARLVAQKYGTRHTEIELSATELLRLLPEALSAADHPGGDGVNTWVVSRAAKHAGVTVVLSGMGGDELFAGYPIFKQMHDLQSKRWLLSFPKFARRLGAAMLARNMSGVAAEKVVAVLTEDYFDVDYIYPHSREVISRKGALAMLCGATGSADGVFNRVHADVGYGTQGYALPLLSRVSHAELANYLTPVLLRDADQMGMAHGLEIREPFLDHNLVELVLGIPDSLKYPTRPKRLLTDALGDMLPHEVVHRPKMGFTFPWAEWMRGDLRPFCGDLMASLARRTPFNEAVVMGRWDAFLKGNPRVTWSRIWYLCALEHWMAANRIEIA